MKSRIFDPVPGEKWYTTRLRAFFNNYLVNISTTSHAFCGQPSSSGTRCRCILR